MHTLSSDVIAEAFALSNAKGADLLAELGRFEVWRGDLAAMRGDDPRGAESAADSRTALRGAAFQEAVMLAKAIELLTADCRSTLAAAYANRASRADDRVIHDCERRLLEIYESLLPEYSAR